METERTILIRINLFQPPQQCQLLVSRKALEQSADATSVILKLMHMRAVEIPGPNWRIDFVIHLILYTKNFTVEQLLIYIL